MDANSSKQYVNEIPEKFADIKSEWLQLLMQIGYVACGQGKPTAAVSIFEAIAAVRPNSELPLIGLAVSLVNLGKLTAACDVLVERSAKINPNNQLAKTVAAMIFRMVKEFQASDILIDEIIADGTDPEAVNFAKNLKNENFIYLRSKGN
ncbi:MAG: hypothetical protein LBS68_03520 [Puniceicoccales bacterium]|jgi:predicted Zn-dependent protease|nr:hypothetical protein [Puniceicoccales bacterium]